jgi:lipopolysaccharide assembly outer membrane protein LptD (OstA)
MKLFPAIALFFFVIAAAFAAGAPSEESWEVESLNRVLPGVAEGQVFYDLAAGTATGTNGVFIHYGSPVYGDAVLTADNVFVNTKTGDADADGNVRIESGDLLWVGDHIHYNFKTRQMRSEQFRTGKLPVFAGGTQLTGDGSNRVYTARSAFFTTDDAADPAYKIRASRIKIIPGKSVQMWNAVAYVDGVPVFYYPYYHRDISSKANNFMFIPGYRSRYGAYVLSTYRWYLGDLADGIIHADYRAKRGPGAGPDVNLHLGQWGDATIKYYYQHDSRPDYSTNAFPQFGPIPENRQRFYLGWQATPATNLNLKALVNYQSDPLFLHDFFEGDYRANPQPNTFVEANKYWDNWSLDALTTPRVNSFYDQVERLPDVKLTGYRQEVLDTPVYYDSESSVGWYRDYDSYASSNTNGLYAGTNGFYAASAARADTYHQFTLPWTFFNWLNVTPRVGGRLTYYSSQSYNSVNVTNGLPSSDVYREVFNTGVGTSFKASQLWSDATNSFWQVDGLRHIIEPSANYVFVPDPSTPPAR